MVLMTGLFYPGWKWYTRAPLLALALRMVGAKSLLTLIDAAL
jgi:hypothetical protein